MLKCKLYTYRIFSYFYNDFFSPIPLFTGRRACLGDILAKMELFLFVGEILKHFEFEAEDIDSLPRPETAKLGATLIPDAFYVKANRLS